MNSEGWATSGAFDAMNSPSGLTGISGLKLGSIFTLDGAGGWGDYIGGEGLAASGFLTGAGGFESGMADRFYGRLLTLNYDLMVELTMAGIYY